MRKRVLYQAQLVTQQLTHSHVCENQLLLLCQTKKKKKNPAILQIQRLFQTPWQGLSGN